MSLMIYLNGIEIFVQVIFLLLFGECNKGMYSGVNDCLVIVEDDKLL